MSTTLAPPRAPSAPARDRLVARLGAGATAEVFLVRRTGPGDFEKLLALKRVRSDLDPMVFAPMILREARLLTALQHPNIVQVYDAGVDAAGLWFLMDYVHGKSLAAVLARAAERGAPIPLGCAAHLGSSVAQALHYAHHAETSTDGRLGVIHRDLTPGNVLVSFDGIVKLGDFGIARSNHLYRETQDGVFQGTPAYAAPEQRRGQPLDAASDLFSLGVVLHEVVTGRPPPAAPPRGARADTAAPPALATLRPDAPAELAALLAQLVEQDPTRRVRSGAELAQRLDGLAIAHQLSATRESLAELMQRLYPAAEQRLPAADAPLPAATRRQRAPAPRRRSPPRPSGTPTVVERAPAAGSARPQVPPHATARSVRAPVAVALAASAAVLAGVATFLATSRPAPRSSPALDAAGEPALDAAGEPALDAAGEPALHAAAPTPSAPPKPRPVPADELAGRAAGDASADARDHAAAPKPAPAPAPAPRHAAPPAARGPHAELERPHAPLAQRGQRARAGGEPLMVRDW